MKFGQALKDITKYNVTGIKAVEMLEKENAYIQGMLNHGYTDAGLADEQISINDKAIANLNKQQSNNKGDVSMTKDQLRNELRAYNVELSNTQFRATKLAELEKMLINAKAGDNLLPLDAYDHLVESNNSNNEGDVNMNNQLQTQSTEDLMANFLKVAQDTLGVTKLVGAQVKISETKVKNHVSMTGGKVVAELSKKIDSLEGTIKALVNNGATTVKYTNVTNPNQTNTQYNQAAATLKPLGYVLDEKTGQQVAYFGVCSVCGAKIKSAKVVQYSMQRYGKVICYAHQNKAGATQQPIQTQSKIVEHKCMYCGDVARFKDVETFNKLSARAKELGLAPFAHIACWKAAKETKKNVDEYMTNQQTQSTQSMISEDAARAIADMIPDNQQPKVEIPQGNVWEAAPTDDDTNNGTQCY